AYGGSTDPYTPNPGTTANGSVCDDNSMGVAIPMSWPNFRSYFGRTVEISYNGQTVLATVNDCGGMGGGSRSLDLQPGVWKAFGFSSCLDWGLRTVNYRFL
ncbi:MAG: RlpA-like double-psi beta-barrel domain-containing protein, partial [Eggerthella lenta]